MKPLPCPFCGKLPKVWQDEEMHPFGPVPTEWVVECCVEMRDGKKNRLIKRWNKRHENDQDERLPSV